MKISPSIFICQPESTTQAGSTFVFLVVTVSPGSHAQPVRFPGGERFQGNDNGGSLLCLVIFTECCGPLAYSINTHCALNKLDILQDGEGKKTTKTWWIRSFVTKCFKGVFSKSTFIISFFFFIEYFYFCCRSFCSSAEWNMHSTMKCIDENSLPHTQTEGEGFSTSLVSPFRCRDT